MTPTNRFRFALVDGQDPIRVKLLVSYDQATTAVVLQQWWKASDGEMAYGGSTDGEWRDVPLEQ